MIQKKELMSAAGSSPPANSDDYLYNISQQSLFSRMLIIVGKGNDNLSNVRSNTNKY